MKKKQSSGNATPKRSCDPVDEVTIDPFEDTSWVVVKKQRVTILLPPQSVSERCLVQDVGTRGADPHPQGVSPSSDQSSREIVVSKVDELSTLRINGVVKSSSPFRNIGRRSSAGGPHASGNRVEPLNQMDASVELATPIEISLLQAYTPSTVPPPDKIDTSRDFDEYPTARIDTMIKRWSTFTSPNSHWRCITGGPCVFLDGPELLTRQLRARNLKRKLEEAGGLVGWLLSMGLLQFVKIFKHKPVNEFQLASLTMQKLKEMGAAAIGPRRKLMHAINCVSRPCLTVKAFRGPSLG